MQFFSQELCSHIDKSSGKKFDDMFLVKIANKGTSLSNFLLSFQKWNKIYIS